MLKKIDNNRNNEFFESDKEKIFFNQKTQSSEKISEKTNQLLQKILNWGQFNNTDIWLMIHEYSKNQKELSKNLQDLAENPRDFDISIFENDEKIFRIVKNFQEKYNSQKIN